ncbi:hypothetical protein K466DRAFT_658598 [Polyporus arcularius HHB13444]|uniref:Sld7 C-terminal domain-containing protein n=1 Tax=Polyporus arcularius HHB13444 TaxID=1314778 RepID=A0A5C3PZ84_9APHY|nr:hypothetical protein K466DRAFT_658598 [Polyporus arcularius HHB13444]
MDTLSKSAGPAHRLLYRGSLSLPDSHLLLDGLSFSVKLGDVHGSPALFNNTLALTLESLRGLPLHLIGPAKVKDTWIDPLGDINVDIHPDAALTRIYFENMFCLTPIPPGQERTEYGIRVSLTDDNDPDTPDLLIYGELRDTAPNGESSVPSTSQAPPKTFHLLAARILPGPPPPPSFRLPRPDDPTPRRPPLATGSKRARDASGVPFDLSGVAAQGGKRTKLTDTKGKGRDEDALRKAAAETMLRMPKPQKAAQSVVSVKALGKEARVGVKRDKDVFKVPRVPSRAGLGRSTSEADVFGSLKGGPLEAVVGNAEIERENKNAVKRAVTKRLAEEGIEKTHPEFKNVFQMCYQGAAFALRRRMAVSPLDSAAIEHFVEAHVRMYVCEAPS